MALWTHACLRIALFSICGTVVAGTEVPVLSVCEILADRLAYNGKTVVVVGRTVSTTEGSWLDQECGQKLVIDGSEWPWDISLS